MATVKIDQDPLAQLAVGIKEGGAVGEGNKRERFAVGKMSWGGRGVGPAGYTGCTGGGDGPL